MDRPPPPPEAVLIRLVRQAAKVTVRGAAKRAGISTARWTQIEQGYETRDGEPRAAWAPPDTLAYMAAAIDLPAGRLETEGQRPDAAAVLREMQRQPGTPPPAPPPEPRFADPRLQYVMDTPGLDLETRLLLVDLTRAIIARREAQNHRSA